MRRRLAALFAVLLLGAMADGGETAQVPFFDMVDDGRYDPAPPPPTVGPFDAAILDLCGGWDAPVRKAAFLAMLDAFPKERAVLIQAAGGDIDIFTDRWFRREAFKHVLCGDPGRKSLGGLHWAPRYKQAQDRGWISRLTTCKRTEILPPVYTLGILYQRGDGASGMDEKCPGGYALTLTALDILQAGAKVAPVRSGRSVCIARERDVPLLVVIEDGALVTLYPDATPDQSKPACGR